MRIIADLEYRLEAQSSYSTMATPEPVAAAASSLDIPAKSGEDSKPATEEELVKEVPSDKHNGDAEPEPSKPLEPKSKEDAAASTEGAAIQVSQNAKSAQDRERQAQNALRVEQGQKWNKRDRHQGNGKVHGKYGKQNKFDPTSQKESSDPNEIRKQVLMTQPSLTNRS